MDGASAISRAGWIAGLTAAACLAAADGLPAAPPDDPHGPASRRAAPVAGGAEVVAEQPLPRRAITRPSPRAAAAEAPAAGRLPTRGSWWGSLASLAAVLAMILVGARLWKKHGPLGRTGLPAEAVDVLGRRVLDPRQSIFLVRLGSRMLVLGSTPAGLSTLAEITDPVEVDLLAGFCRPAAGDAAPDKPRRFAALFDRHASTPPPGPRAGEAGTPSFDGGEASAVRERLRRAEEAHA
ncbi:MAG TPA: flagellar biosynthetic protein FliO [Planctomycetaceae bacterium]|nr:flagellar biosynthetic protein FliO [Planctomycetaceae bacterium]